MSLTFTNVTSLWKSEKRQWVKPSTYAEYIYHLNKHILPFFGPMDSGSINEDSVQRFVNGLLAEGLSQSTIRDCLMVFRMLLRHGSKLGAWKLIAFDVHFPSDVEKKRSVCVLSASDQKVLLAHLKQNFSFRNLGILICLHTGLRIGEICGLQWKDLDIEAGVIRVTKTVQRIWLNDDGEKSYSLSVGTPKTPTSNRDIPICRELMKTIRPLRKLMADDFYVVSNSAEPLEPRYYRDYFRKLLGRLDIPQIRFHGLRHSFATRCIESKCDYKTVSAILGHSSIATTMDLYVHPGYDEKKRAIEKMARMLK